MAGGVFLLAMLAGAAPAQGGDWPVYANARFEYGICYPADLLIPQGEAPNGDGQRFLAADGAELAVYGRYNALDTSLKGEIERQGMRLKGPGGRVTYRARKGESATISGLAGNRVFYARTFLHDGKLLSFELTYPQSAQKRYGPVLTRLARCFGPM
ncbi:hypothetical protein ACFQ1E_11580 [Sphingomonas canadensis]|uniref:Uncharacterized protein n=1 Tax=Sphingomonas canadensis TaxID=1219257 RepID=A0ABW3H689_9SPHN|nr:hypothetical protein [Sphingomonas canadensis]MCW3836884.1 hypothetical protein [Sphingomonas canadensis]